MENDIHNAEEIHFSINVDNGQTIGFRGEENVNYADIFSDEEEMAMLVRLSGEVSSAIQPPRIEIPRILSVISLIVHLAFISHKISGEE